MMELDYEHICFQNVQILGFFCETYKQSIIFHLPATRIAEH